MGENRIKKLIDDGELVIAPGAYDSLSALIIERVGFDAVYVTGAGASYSKLGMQDMGFVGLHDIADSIFRMSNRISLPLICDADTGYGNDYNVRYTVRTYEKAGAEAIQLEDQKLPKKCGHLKGKVLEPTDEMVLKLKAAIKERKRALIIGRTDAISVAGLDEAISRANEYHRAGADITFVESPRTLEEITTIANEVKGHKLINMVEGGKTPIVPASTLKELGFSVVIYPNSAIRSVCYAINKTMKLLKRDGSTEGNLDSMYDFNSLQDLIGVFKE